MLEWLEQVFDAKVDSSQQLREARTRQEAYTAAQNQEARKRGFKSAHEMVEFERQRQMKRQGTTMGKARGVVQQGIDTVKTAHPKGVLEMVTEALKRANEGN